MNVQVPAYLQGKPTTRRLTESAMQGIGSSLPPRISIQGNQFTLIDGANTENTIGASMDAVVVDVSDVVAKRYMDPDKPWTPDSNDPPLCWSSNGIGPSVESGTPQARTCAECPQNVRGSAVSKMSGASVKACRDEKYLAILLPQYPQMMFRLLVSPGSFANWRDYLKKFEGQQFDLDDVITRIGFQPKVNGVLTFQAVAHVDGALVATRNAALVDAKARDVLVGRNDWPIGGEARALSASNAGSQQTLAAPVQTQAPAPGVFPSEGAPAAAQDPPKRRGRPRADATPAASSAAGGPAEPAQAPFRPAPSPVAPAASSAAGGPAAPFGVGPGVAPNAELAAALDSVFGPQK